ncbi:hypothetical protein AUEXF2481DRAFT_26985 [Aureobasidium subglaciale EXF-2481]|uniref:Uncharacterized protein n=1 Tax=Aureobasidium subglaciale (strain EXF-2481) TaxID=1043005 RepID=A0A074YLH5_AURSE|nr:uncharacterized protein AUEXF2481DRAFT_26985 [Aureobasidium subglaciale EXF-2481]KAI5193519.1 hypothetical protein E4T38_09927 [Aureobasidium subglaciale]KAI5213075.1 hypothetical protein E4T40_09931 [Aureobasidium subglaciale]KAI5214298.1 hypothetical protein E4T41_09940 [Aureobasidium subglaciale]KAI5252478.1 hypothetical protein E4T46_09927 [Aureobasidium subglaciale]KEQ98628.1 hypothetical protein AUEXF2481DRAFT_26985 [Aureobasidium subglaciale EXF-2481]
MALQPPAEPIENLKDPGAHELPGVPKITEPEESDDHFSDASEGTPSYPPAFTGRNRALSIPVTRVEKVDDEPRHGEVPGTQAYNIRSQDAVPDEIEIVPDGTRSRSTSHVSESDRPVTPGGTPVPHLVVEKVDPSAPSHGDVPGTDAYEMRSADAKPDEVVQAPASSSAPLEPSPTPNDRSRSPSPPFDQEVADVLIPSEKLHSQTSQETSQSELPLHPKIDTTTAQAIEENEDDFDDFDQVQTQNNHQADNADDAFGDDFDDFEEGEQADGDEDDDFGDFDDGFQQAQETPVAAPPPQPVQQPLAHLPNLNFDDLQTSDDILEAMSPYMSELFPELYDPEASSTDKSATLPTDPILTDRSASLWSQLVAPPPLQPPNWIRSRIRRLFLVSLGVPVDLDEILPASKQKKLVLPNIHLPEQKKEEEKAKQNGGSTGGRKGPAPPPEFNANEAVMLAKTTDTAIEAYSDDELKAHVQRLEELIKDASTVLEYWVKRKESAVGDKEAFEGVIENLVGFVKSRR